MSISDDLGSAIGTIFNVLSGDEDTLYPDNPNRRRRAEEVYNDVRNLQHEALELQRLAQVLLSSFAEISANAVGISQLDFKSWSVQAPDSLRETMGLGEIAEAFSFAGILAVPDADRQKHLIEVIDLPMDAKLITIGGVPLPPMSGVLAGAIAGSEMRDRLQGYIAELLRVRIRMKYYVLILRAVTERVSALAERGTLVELGYDRDKIDKLFRAKGAEIKTAVAAITEQSATRELAEFDKQRCSWTNEDR